MFMLVDATNRIPRGYFLTEVCLKLKSEQKYIYISRFGEYWK